ncbi:hypothetical protein RPIT_14435 [Tessaracoccus flavus]|uniref:Uncharacterized protein n=1 Tax=Tessaracoccus flavus TaxID=1610493 RepID=A0A1Q2CIC0_9ACTN|nr:hypothetical protein RPIT_14435 [Tessaracoccus flavus]SDZ07062.1 hypothetical protein SAMN05428934_109129 [Tessaracoccus flavus]
MLPPGYRNGRLHLDDDKLRVLETDFDVAAYTRNARGPISVDGDVTLAPDARRDVGYLWRVEHEALGDLRKMLSSWTSNEARITAFLGTWAYERYWNARALRDLLTADGSPAPRPLPRRGLHARLVGAYVEYLLPGVSAIGGIVVGEPVTAGHMARMAVHEGGLQVAYRALLPRLDGAAHDVVADVIERRESFVDFFRQEAAARVRRSPAERLSAAIAVGPQFVPMRPDGVPDPGEAETFGALFSSREARSALVESDRAIASLLPGRPLPSVRAVRRRLRRPLIHRLTRSPHHGI